MNVKLMVAGGVGYILGRTRKGKAALKFALWAGGHDANLKDLVRGQAMRLLASEEGRNLLAQLRGPVIESGRKAALSGYERRVGAVTRGLSQRTSEIRHSLEETPPAELGGLPGTLVGALSDTFGHRGVSVGEQTADEAAGAEPDQTSEAAPTKAPAGRAETPDGSQSPRVETEAARAEAPEPTDRDREPARHGPAQDRRPPSRHLDTRPAADRKAKAPVTGGKRAHAASSPK
jgi:hypothetical protein